MNETMDDVTTGDYNVTIGHDDETTIKHPERKSEDKASKPTELDIQSRTREDDESSMSWKFVLGMIILAVLLSFNL